MTTPQDVRDSNLTFLNEHGFKPATWMPLPSAVGESSAGSPFAGGTLRPETEIASRLLCHCAVFAWGSAPADFEQRISDFISKNQLRSILTGEEFEIIDMPKGEASEQFAHTVGWRLENMWSLAWILGLSDEPSATTGQLPEEASSTLMGLFLPDFTITSNSILAQGKTQAIEDIVRMEDRFYLAHNAVRSGQIGEESTLPDGFDPLGDGGAIHERRHSLTWALSPGTAWDDTDLST